MSLSLPQCRDPVASVPAHGDLSGFPDGPLCPQLKLQGAPEGWLLVLASGRRRSVGAARSGIVVQEVGSDGPRGGGQWPGVASPLFT